MLLLGIDIGTSSIKVSVVDADTKQVVVATQFPETERTIRSLQPGWAEQSPLQWWEDVKQAIAKANATKKYDPKNIRSIGIAYQMHGLVCIDKNKNVLRDSIIWCDSRAVSIGNKAFEQIGAANCLSHLLNSPGNFTASKLAWVKQYEPEIFAKIDTILLPGDYIAMQLTGERTTTISSLSEGIFWDFKNNQLSEEVLNYFGFDHSIIPAIKDTFSEHGKLLATVADELGLSPGIPIAYKAGDQPNNALSLNVLHPGEVAATAGTSGVIYGVSDQLTSDKQSRINSFAHVNHTASINSIGVLLCINGTGILNSWVKKMTGAASYQQMNDAAKKIQPGSEGLQIFPFGNGAERMLNNVAAGSSFQHINFNIHGPAHIFRAAQEGIAFAFRYGLDIMRENGMHPSIIKAGKANMFLSDVFTEAFVNATNTPVELYNCDGAVGAAIGGGIGAKIFSEKEAFAGNNLLQLVEPTNDNPYDELYEKWKDQLNTLLQTI
ncbi:carbohydrate kinase [Ferruginibacter lapsinanis]|uniref:xylulokinase n=1 Tax=Ferruginibacter lapsinanis TaxID=563172 RepID=UPI001E29F339|nr:FGGY family carbohydrate kinase [Ferruginibacter lapsinanis]UEG49384.1 carbohydrate kinase [Ferruginibacter lapsinanis]